MSVSATRQAIWNWYSGIHHRLWQCPVCSHVWSEKKLSCHNCWSSEKPDEDGLFKVHPDDRWAFDAIKEKP